MFEMMLLAGLALADDSECTIHFKVGCMTGEMEREFGAEVIKKDDLALDVVEADTDMKCGEILTFVGPADSYDLWVDSVVVHTASCGAGETLSPYVVLPAEPEEDEDGSPDYESEPTLVRGAAPPGPPPLPLAPPPPPVRVAPVVSRPLTISDMHRVGWATPSRPPIWVGNAGDFPGGDSLGRGGEWTGSQRTCPEGEFAAVLGTTDHPRGGMETQLLLDHGRAAEVSHPSTAGAYVVEIRTVIQGDRAASVSCVTPGEITPSSLEGEAIAGPPELPMADLVVEEISGPANLLVGMEGTYRATVRNVGTAPAQVSTLRFLMDGATLVDVAVVPLEPGMAASVQTTWTPDHTSLHGLEAVADVNNVVSEKEEWNNQADLWVNIETPAPEPEMVIKRQAFVTRFGPWAALSVNPMLGEGVPTYVHGLGGGFVTFRLGERWGLEPFAGVGTDGESTHACDREQDGTLVYCTGRHPSTTVGSRLLFRVVDFGPFRLSVYPEGGTVLDDITKGWSAWAQWWYLAGGAELTVQKGALQGATLTASIGGGSTTDFQGIEHVNRASVPFNVQFKWWFDGHRKDDETLEPEPMDDGDETSP